MNWLNEFLTAVDVALQHGAGMSIIVGLVIALGGTQWLKFVLLRSHWLPDPDKWIIKALCLPIGAGATIASWPANSDWTIRILMGVAVGVSAPWVYRWGVTIIYWIKPEWEAKLSVDPYNDERL